MTRLPDGLLLLALVLVPSHAWVVPHYHHHAHKKCLTIRRDRPLAAMSDEEDVTSGPVEYDDFQDFIGESFDTTDKAFAKPVPSSSSSDDDDKRQVEKEDDSVDQPFRDNTRTEVLPLPKLVPDRSACRTRKFSLGPEVILDRYLGTLGFQEVTDWQYYVTDQDQDGQIVDGGDRREKVSPNPLDPSQPRRTRQSSGSIMRLFRAEFVGALGGLLRSQGLENRVLIKEFSGELGLALADQESRALAQFQSSSSSKLLVSKDDEEEDWRNNAMTRSNNPRPDNLRLVKMVRQLPQCPFTVLLGEVDLAEVEDEDGWDANEVRANVTIVCVITHLWWY